MYSLETKNVKATAEQRSKEWMPAHRNDREADGLQFAYRPLGYRDNRVPQLTLVSAIEVVDLDTAGCIRSITKNDHLVAVRRAFSRKIGTNSDASYTVSWYSSNPENNATNSYAVCGNSTFQVLKNKDLATLYS